MPGGRKKSNIPAQHRLDTIMELWGGIECTINRVNDLYMDQLGYCGYYDRDDMMRCLVSSGVNKLRYPLLWERYQCSKDCEPDWQFAEQQLLFLRKAGIEPIAGLVHHGSGPPYVHIGDDSFAEGLAAYAAEVARKFPWINYYTPVNEPLTTARFCGLYGHWFPHKKDDSSFIKILVSECKATVMAMKAIRDINPEARLVQTEDLGKIHSTPTLEYQANFENTRRWLSIDLLCGKVNRGHELWHYLLSAGISIADLEYLSANPCPPDILGFNYYITSERFLDERTSYYPHHTHGSNGRHRYADVEAVRVSTALISGPAKLLAEAWERYKLPLAITEAHLHCSREEQLRWFALIWQAALRLRKKGVDIRAVTAWAMFGSFGWNKLLTLPDGDFEPGVFYKRSDPPRPTALAKMLRALAANKKYKHPVTAARGWWQREIRALYYPGSFRKPRGKKPGSGRPLFIIGSTESVRAAFEAACELRNIHYKTLARDNGGTSELLYIETLISEHNPWAIIDTSCCSSANSGTEEQGCNTNETGLATLCCRHRIKLMQLFQDPPHSGSKRPLPPSTPDGLTAGQTTHPVDNSIEQPASPHVLFIQTGLLFSPGDAGNILTIDARSPQTHKLRFFSPDGLIALSYLPDLVHTSLDLLIDDENGVWTLLSGPPISPQNLSCQIANARGQQPASGTSEGPGLHGAGKCKNNARGSNLLPPLENALKRYFT